MEIEFEVKENHQIYWDDVAMFCYPEEYQLGIYPMEQGDAVEIDDINELMSIDNRYEIYKGEICNEEE